MKKKNNGADTALTIISAVITLAMLIILVSAITQMGNDSITEGREQLERSLRRAVTACYAEEGMYPPSLSYIEKNYGLQVDEDRYEVHYSVFGENLAPDITVIEKNDD